MAGAERRLCGGAVVAVCGWRGVGGAGCRCRVRGRVWGTSIGVLAHSRKLALLPLASADLTEVIPTFIGWSSPTEVKQLPLAPVEAHGC
jgi:hypothetical protein